MKNVKKVFTMSGTGRSASQAQAATSERDDTKPSDGETEQVDPSLIECTLDDILSGLSNPKNEYMNGKSCQFLNEMSASEKQQTTRDRSQSDISGISGTKIKLAKSRRRLQQGYLKPPADTSSSHVHTEEIYKDPSEIFQFDPRASHSSLEQNEPIYCSAEDYAPNKPHSTRPDSCPSYYEESIDSSERYFHDPSTTDPSLNYYEESVDSTIYAIPDVPPHITVTNEILLDPDPVYYNVPNIASYENIAKNLDPRNSVNIDTMYENIVLSPSPSPAILINENLYEDSVSIASKKGPSFYEDSTLLSHQSTSLSHQSMSLSQQRTSLSHQNTSLSKQGTPLHEEKTLPIYEESTSPSYSKKSTSQFDQSLYKDDQVVYDYSTSVYNERRAIFDNYNDNQSMYDKSRNDVDTKNTSDDSDDDDYLTPVDCISTMTDGINNNNNNTDYSVPSNTPKLDYIGSDAGPGIPSKQQFLDLSFGLDSRQRSKSENDLSRTLVRTGTSHKKFQEMTDDDVCITENNFFARQIKMDGIIYKIPSNVPKPDHPDANNGPELPPKESLKCHRRLSREHAIRFKSETDLTTLRQSGMSYLKALKRNSANLDGSDDERFSIYI